MNLLPVIVFLSIIITTFNSGFFSFPGIFLLLIFYFLICLFFFRPATDLNKSDLPVYTLLLIISSALLLYFSNGIYQEKMIFSILQNVILFISFCLILTYIYPVSRRFRVLYKIRFVILTVCAIITRIFMIIASPGPVIDVFVMLKEAPQLFLSGGNPYTAVFSPVYPGVTGNYFTYWPAAFLLQIPFVYIFHDPRILLVISDSVCMYLIYKIGNKNMFAQIFSLIYLFRPNSNFIIEQSWLTPLTLMLFFLSIFKLINGKKKDGNNPVLSAFFLGLLGSVQPYFLMIVPLILLKISKVIRYSLVLILTLGIIVMPFYLWNQKEFINDTIFFFLKSAKDMPSVPVYRSLNLNTLYYIFTNKDLTPAFSVLAFTGAFLSVFYKVLRTENVKTAFYENSAKTLLSGIILVYLSFYILLKFSFINYYYFITGIILFMGSFLYSRAGTGK